jgi:hypothetical protein
LWGEGRERENKWLSQERCKQDRKGKEEKEKDREGEHKIDLLYSGEDTCLKK